jgi:hypothetical protein
MTSLPRARRAAACCAMLLTTFATAAAVAQAASAPALDAAPAGAPSISFAGVPYVHRWSKDGQNEFTPVPETNLLAWNDMVTVIVYEKVKNGDQLAQVANNTAGLYQKAGKIVRTSSVPASPGHPAEHLLVAVLNDPAYLEVAFAHFVLGPGVGESVVYSHRLYGTQERAAMGEWLVANGAKTEKALMAWNGAPSPDALRALPQSIK